MKIKSFKGGFDSNFTYVISEGNECFILDSAIDPNIILSYLNENNLKPIALIILHSHYDHTVDLEKYKEHNIPIWAHESTKLNVNRKLKDNEIIKLNNTEIKVIHTPGHRYDCICLLEENKLFTSDTLFVGTCGRVDLEGSNPEDMKNTLNRLKQLPDNTIIYPGHDYGSTETSTITREKKENKCF